MSAEKNCNLIGKNTGLGCIPALRAALMLIFVPTFSNAGVRNVIDLTAVLDEDFFLDKVNAADPSERWYPTPFFKNVLDERGDPIMEASDDGEEFFVQDAIRKWAGFHFAEDASPQYTGIVNSFRSGNNMSVFIIDLGKNIQGTYNEADLELRPVEINASTIWAGLIKPTNKTINKIKVMFSIAANEDDSEITMITADQMTYDVTQLEGLVDITGVFSGVLATQVTLTLTAKGGTPLGPIMDEGLVVADFVSSVTAVASKIRNVTTNADVAITSVTETAPGVYDIVFPTQTGDDIVVDIKKNGRDYTAVKAIVTTLP